MVSNDITLRGLSYSEMDVSELSYVNEKKCTRILYDDNSLCIKTEMVYTPFGVEKEYNNYYVKIIENKESEELFAKIREIEKAIYGHLKKETGKDYVNYGSQIFSRNGYKDFLKLKLPMKGGQFSVDVFNKMGDRKTIYDITPKKNMQIEIDIDTIWYFREKYSSVFKLKKAIVEE